MASPEKKSSDPNQIVVLAETEKLKRDVFRPDMEKLKLFTKMLRTNMLLKKAVIHHK